MLGAGLVLLLIVGAAIAVFLVWLLPKCQIRTLTVPEERRFELENESRKTVAQIVGGAVLLAGLYFTAQTLRTGQETLRVNQEGQITERFTKAIDHLGNKELPVKLGGIYALERIARDSERDRGPIIEVLTAYVRENAALSTLHDGETKAAMSVKGGAEGKMLTADIQAILTVLGRRTRSPFQTIKPEGRQSEPLQGPNLHLTDLRGAYLVGADLQEANLYMVNLKGAWLYKADLRGAYLRGADLQDTILDLAKLEGANLSGANLRGAMVTQQQLDSARTDASTVCPHSLKCPK